MSNSPEKPQLLRALGLREGIAIHVGCIIGSGIFLKPAVIAGYLEATGPILLVWIVAGLLSLFGALSIAELSAVLPQTGGPYVYLRESFGKVWGFLFSWNDFFINKAGSVAAISIAFTTYAGHFFPALSPEHAFLRTQWMLFDQPMPFVVGWNQIVALCLIALVTIINIRGVQFGGWVMNIFTAAKVFALVGLTFAVALSGKGSSSNFLPWWPEEMSWNYLSAFGLALTSALWAYDGWLTVTLNSGEFRNPKRDLPISLIAGTLIVIGVYLAANLAFAYIVPVPQMSGSPRIAADVAAIVLGPIGASLIILGIMASTFGATNGQLLAGPRTLYAGGKDGVFPHVFGKVHPRYHSPYVAILTLGVWGMILTFSGTFDQITNFVVFTSWGFYALSALAVIVLRRKMPDADRPYKAWGYPYATLAFVAVTLWFLWNVAVNETRDAMIGIGLLLISLPLYKYWTRRQ
ncbi:MAG: amino acid permease [Bacteroidetes bacterium]|nr:amino acid permease [Bacteroidota bacterium]MCW5895394.1 amino acid permease [Bacteroidota bacterium]